MKTYYDILGVVPGSDAMTINIAFNACIRDELDDIDYPRGAMWWHPRLIRIKELTEAMETLGHGERRTEYHRKLAGAGLVCSLCQGHGRIQYGKGTFANSGHTNLQCAACNGTGKGFEIPGE